MATLRPPADDAVRGLPLERLESFSEGKGNDGDPDEPRLPKFQERFRSYWGIDKARIRNIACISDSLRADASHHGRPERVAVSGSSTFDGASVWYAADEWAWHHLSQVRLLSPSTWGNVRQAAVKGLYEWAYGSLLDRVWVVSEGDRRAMRAGGRAFAMWTSYPTVWTANTLLRAEFAAAGTDLVRSGG